MRTDEYGTRPMPADEDGTRAMPDDEDETRTMATPPGPLSRTGRGGAGIAAPSHVAAPSHDVAPSHVAATSHVAAPSRVVSSLRVAAAVWVALAGAPVRAADAPSSTTVQTPRPRATIDEDTAAADVAAATADPVEAMTGLMGTALARDGGPLAPSRVVVRGLSGSRVGLFLDGLRLDDPALGGFDASAAPLFASSALRGDAGASSTTMGGDVAMTTLDVFEPTVVGRVGVGTLSTARASVLMGGPIAQGTALVGAEAATTRGDFSYRPTGALGASTDDLRTRKNDDHRRASGLARGAAILGALDLEALVFAAGHEGGIPGFAQAPTDGLRGRDGTVAARGVVHAGANGLVADVAVDGRVATRATWDAQHPAPDALTSTALRLAMTTRTTQRLWGARGVVDVELGRVDLAARAFTRTGTRGRLAIDWVGLDRLVLVDGDVSLDALDDVGLLPGGSLGVEVGPRIFAGTLRAAHRARAPTLDELYAPRGLVLGNAELAPESASDVEAGFVVRPGTVIAARAVAFAGRIDEAILFLNRNAYEIAPVNTGPALRAGGELHVTATPHRFAALDVVGSALWSRVDATDAPLPLAAPFHSRMALRVGDAAGASTTLVLRGKAASPSNLFGGLTAPGYALLDAVAAMPLGPGLRASLALTNALDVLDARDQNGFPLPGRQVFVSLEVRR